MFKGIGAIIKSFNFFKKEDEKLRDENFEEEDDIKWYYYPISIIVILFLLFYYNNISNRIDLVYKVQAKQLNLNIDEIINKTDMMLDYEQEDEFDFGLKFKDSYEIYRNIQKSAFLFEDIDFDFIDYINSSISFIKQCVDKKEVNNIDKDILLMINKDLKNAKEIFNKNQDIDIYIMSKARKDLKERYKELNLQFENIELDDRIAQIYMNTSEDFKGKKIYNIIYKLLEREFDYIMINNYESKKEDGLDEDRVVIVKFDDGIRLRKVWNRRDISTKDSIFEFNILQQEKLLNYDKVIQNYLNENEIYDIKVEYDTSKHLLPQEYEEELLNDIDVNDGEYEIYSEIHYEFEFEDMIVQLDFDSTGLLDSKIDINKNKLD
ncbi:MAG: hypothetical protein N4A54_04615 [Peptostreptococcaceae bacterium]|nr:hypothetical protein [Peptostreptococcaceae bacterium]